MYESRGCDPARSVVDRRVDPVLAHEVAAAYLDAPSRRDPLTEAAYADLVTESDRLFRRITSTDQPDPVRVVFTTCSMPYHDAQELIGSVTADRVLEVTTVASDAHRRHPLMGNEAGGGYDRFRAVHDILGHARLRLGFDRDGEFAVWLTQERLHGPLARRALATELHGQHSVCWTTGQLAELKAVLLEPELLRRARLRGAGTHGADPRGDRRNATRRALVVNGHYFCTSTHALTPATLDQRRRAELSKRASRALEAAQQPTVGAVILRPRQ